MTLRYGSVCSGIEAASVAWEPLGWQPVFFSEIEPFPCEVLAHHYGANLPGEPHATNGVPNYGDMTKFREWPDADIDVLVGGTPCQDNSIGYSAGKGRAGDGLSGARSGLAWSFVGCVARYNPEIFVWENVPNILSRRHSGGFLRFAKALGDCGFHIAWRVIDSATPYLSDQPRPRLFMVGSRRSITHSCAVLFEQHGVAWNRATRETAAPVLTARGGMAFDDRTPCILDERGARIATPLEWERALGFPDGYTDITRRNCKPAADGPRYKALGNSMACNVMRWIGQRIQIAHEVIGNTGRGGA